jgi:NADH dehydrogenase
VGRSAARVLLERGHSLRVLSRHATHDVRDIAAPDGRLEAFDADVTQAPSLNGAAEGCDAVLHLVGIIDERDAEERYEAVHVAGVRNVVREANRAGVARFVHVSALKPEPRTSRFQSSKHDGEAELKKFAREWAILRPGIVYGPDDEVVTLLLRLVRGSRVVPVVRGGNQRFQPIWHEDLAAALANALERDDLHGQTLQVAGREVTTSRAIIESFAKSLERKVACVSLPAATATAASRLAGMLGFTPPLNRNKLSVLLDEYCVEPPSANRLPELLGTEPMEFKAGLRHVMDAMPAQSPRTGFGRAEHKIFSASIRSDVSAADLMRRFKAEWVRISPVEFHAEPGAADHLGYGQTMTGNLPGRGNIQMRVVESTDTHVTMLTVKGHPIAGLVRFFARDGGGALRFTVEVFARPATVLDFFAIMSIGQLFQDGQWRAVVRRTLALADPEQRVRVKKKAEMLDRRQERRLATKVEALDRDTREHGTPVRQVEQPA